MIVILEGTDGVGKTTFAHRLANRMGAKYVHSGPPTAETWIDEYINPLLSSGRPIVLDRWHLGEIVWPFLWDRPSLFSGIEEFEICCEKLASLGAFLGVIVRDDDGIVETLTERGEDDTIHDTLKAQVLFRLLARLASDHMPTAVLDSDRIRGNVDLPVGANALWN